MDKKGGTQTFCFVFSFKVNCFQIACLLVCPQMCTRTLFVFKLNLYQIIKPGRKFYYEKISIKYFKDKINRT